jgi:hypothetical protein
MFGEPARCKFEFVLTGRALHTPLRRRFGGRRGVWRTNFFTGTPPMVSTRSPPTPATLTGSRALRANEAFQMLSGKQREIALLAEPARKNGTTPSSLPERKTDLPGIRVGDLSRDQKEEVHKVMS